MGAKGDPRTSVILLCGQERATGTAFPIHREGNRTWLLTCAHVVEDLGGSDNIRVKYGERLCPVEEVACGSARKIDLAVLAVLDLDVLPLDLHLDGRKGDACSIPGFAELDTSFAAQPLDSELGDWFAVETDGPRVNAWQLRIRGDVRLEPGYSGSPVVRAGTNQVVAVTTHKQYGGERGYAIDVANLVCVWSEIPGKLIHDDSRLPADRRNALKAFIDQMGVTPALMRWFCQLALPLGSSFAIPDEHKAYDLVDWLAEWGGDDWLAKGQGDDWVPLVSVARQLHEKAQEPVRSRLAGWIEKTAEYFGVADVWDQPLIVEATKTAAQSDRPALLVEVVDPTSSEDRRLAVRCFHYIAGRQIPVAPAGNDLYVDPANASDRMAIAEGIRRLLFGFPIDRARVVVEFLLPDDLLGEPVDTWVYSKGGIDRPLGTAFPVVVRSRQRQGFDLFDEFSQEWEDGWDSLCRQKGKRIPEALFRVDTTQRKYLATKPRQGYVCACLCFNPSGTDFLSALISQGICAALWPRKESTSDALHVRILPWLAKDPVEDLPHAVCGMRSALWEDDRVDDPCYHLSLLWDDPTHRLPNAGQTPEDDLLTGIDY